ncbi:MAG: T9SS type A sorting domain-containing protein [Pedobacter sp.]|nr:MAG: T9SS type A sorting domain-containing protein [Pedobacter sp.]
MNDETYIFNLRVVNNFIGPGITVSAVAQRTYGPDVLAAYGQPGYQITYGPDTLFTNSRHISNTSNVAGYLGSGNATFRYTVNGGLTSDLGGINYNYAIVSKYWGSFGLTYFWCPNAVLSTNIKNFSAVKSNKNINLSWIIGNDQKSNTYEIQVSKNGREFHTAGVTKADAFASGTTSKYSYQFNPDQALTGQLYFRIRQVDANGKVSYSTVKALDLDKTGASSFTAYPNPATSKVSLQFDSNLDGDYYVDITNQVGQRMMSKSMRLKNTSQIDLSLHGNHTPGVYYVRVKDASNGQVFTNKILLNR